MSTSPVTSLLCPILIGRTLHLEVLSQIIAQARSGAGQTVLIAGEAGIGKSRLAAEARDLAAAQGFRLRQGNCFEHDRSLPYAPLLDQLRTFFTQLSDAELASSLGQNAPDLVKLLPELSIRLPNLAPAPPLDPEAEKQRLFSTFLRLLTARGGPARGPVLVVIEDLQWCDDTSLELLLQLARRIAAQPVILLLTYRSEETHPALSHFLVELDREHLTTELILQHLTLAEVDEMLRAIFKTDRALGAAFRQTLYTLTEGNPFFIEETLKALTASGSIFLEQGRWDHKPLRELHVPRSIQDAVRRHSEGLSKPARELLELASVAGRQFDFGLLQELTQLGEGELLLLIKEMVAAQLVIEESADRFSFRHALTREAVYRGLLIREQRKYHGLVAGILERAHGNSAEPGVENLAYHFFEAGVWDKALAYSRQAGEKAQALYAPHAAIDHFTRALESAQHLESPTSNLHLARGQNYETVGEFDQAQADFEQCRRAGGDEHNDKLRWQALLALGSLWAGRDYQRAGTYFQQASELARQMGDPYALAHTLNRLGNWHANAGDLEEALGHHQQALVIFQKSNDRHGLAETLDLLGTASQINGDLVGGVNYYLQAVELFRELDDRHGMVSILATLALCGPSYLHELSVSPLSLPKAVENGEAAIKIAREISWRSGEDFSLWCLGICLGPLGEYQRGVEVIQQAQEISEEIEHDQWRTATHCVLGALYLDLFALREAREHLEQALAMALKMGSSVWIGTARGYLASVCIQQKDLPRAQEVLDAELTPQTPAHTQMQRLCWCARAELSLAHGEPEAALAILDRLIAADGNVTSTAVIPRIWKLRGESLIALQRLEEAEGDLRSAQAAATEQGARGWSWRVHAVLGNMYQSQARRGEAEVEFRASQDAIAAIAAPIQDQALRAAYLQSAAAMIPAPASPAGAQKDKFGGLTAREREIAGWIARGASNREIAQGLVLSERTVESHVTKILAKLGFPSRARIAVWAVENGIG